MTKLSENHLGEYVKRARDKKNLAQQDIEDRSGGLISAGHLSRIENGFVTNLTIQSVIALAHALEIPEEELLRVACGIIANDAGDREHERLIDLYNDLSEAGRQLAMTLIEQIWLWERRGSAVFPPVRLPSSEEIQQSKRHTNRPKVKEKVIEVPNGGKSQKAKGQNKSKRRKVNLG